MNKKKEIDGSKKRIKKAEKNKKTEVLSKSVISPNSALDRISNQRLIFNLSTDKINQTNPFFIEKNRELYTSSFIKNIMNKRSKNLWEAVSRDLNGELIGEKNELFSKKSENYQNLIQCLRFSEVSESNMNPDLYISYKHNIKKENIDNCSKPNFIIINSSGSEEELLLNHDSSLVEKYHGKMFKSPIVNSNESGIDSLLLTEDSNLDKNKRISELHTKEIDLKKNLKAEKYASFTEDPLELINTTLDDSLYIESLNENVSLKIMKNDINNDILDEYGLEIKNNSYITKKKDLVEAIETRQISNPEGITMPDFRNYTLVQLQSEVSKYGFKIMHSRKTMIDLLVKCWELSNFSEKKQLIKNDKHNDCGLSQAFGNTLLEQSVTGTLKNCTLLAHLDSNLQSIFLTITKILKSTIGEIYWFKILRYEPIVLEQFIKWLFEQNIVVTLDIVKQYCNIYSICCVHLKTNRGFARKYL
ncbi:hypothetical protein PNEG_02421 [Pneumocystis murina B123]|uniref:Structure-specific endonuclease subunit SLX4 n=1 Tax=Pneumocystis murina (strain B123) TaxID=1069680 RepID=M7P5B8_PNEMU|nr:hypothetical protein PNEG_02421 [Pneumocystis murina B123]EMR09075.1 hypothetical protein PNEG_02421 [Pneumocystis murina B123]